MGSYIFRRLLLAIPTLIGVSILVFGMVRLLPGCPAVAIAGVHATPEFIRQVRQDLGLDKRLDLQYFLFMRRLIRGDIGISTRTSRPVTTEIWDRFPPTVELTVASMLIAMIIGINAGIVSAVKPYSIFDNTSMFGALFGVSVPVFWLGLMLMLLFSVILGWLPSAGRGTMAHLILPSITLGVASAAVNARMTRSCMLDVLHQDYIRTAHAKGLREQVVIIKHALKNAVIPVITILGLQFGILLGGAVLTETVFAWPGVGRLLVDSILARDHPVVQGTVLLLAVIFVFINLFTDLLYSLFDPRIRYE
ncbi:ABC transporter permease [Candidatus Acetothermia bacterium]|jgi:ABC-type dipeptide/oligopeptide/nickel transport system permease component|nr:ABC transporter permease [Candidatus Acetothermia bacterium]MCI2427787.1 ABC transporter permease [Candidatus Acetothermia bacterium]MCI2428684.1 ABC transporter permease [Candidatus Acetothermia bacterium]